MILFALSCLYQDFKDFNSEIYDYQLYQNSTEISDSKLGFGVDPINFKDPSSLSQSGFLNSVSELKGP